MKLIVLEEGSRSELALERPVVSIGRAVTNDIRLSSTLVSRHHCRIERGGEGTFVVDLGSANGTLVNGEKITRKLVAPGDKIQVGGVRILLEPESPAVEDARPNDTQSLSPVADLGPVGLRTMTGEARRERDNLLVFARTTRELARETELNPLLRLIVDSAVGLVGAERGFLLLSANGGSASGSSDAPGASGSSAARAASADAPPSHGGATTNTPAPDARASNGISAPDDSARADADDLSSERVAEEVAKLNVRVARSFDRADIAIPHSRLSLGIAGRVLHSGRPLLSVDAGRDERFSGMASVEDLRLRSVMCLPIQIESKVEGVLYLDNRLQHNAFSHEDLELVELLANQAAIAILNARRVAELREQNQRLDLSRRQIERLNEQLGRKVRDRDTELAVVRAELGRERGRFDYGAIVGASDGMHKVFQQLDRIIESDLPVMITGESGTGKELIARAIHFNGARAAKPFVTENSAALPDTLLESELFGHARGAFTGAHKQKRGLLEQADGGTLFLDEIGDMSAEMQKKLLRVIQEGEFRPVGSDQRIQINVRLLAASHHDLEELVRGGQFREDLYYRVNVLSVRLPPLRERRDDIPLLAEHLLARAAREAGKPVPLFGQDVMSALVSHDWPGNVRELENEMRRLVVLAQDEVRVEHLSRSVIERRSIRDRGGATAPLETAGDIRAAVADLEKRSIEAALAVAGGNKSKAAAELGISRFALQRKLDKYDVGHTRDRAKKEDAAPGDSGASSAAPGHPEQNGPNEPHARSEPAELAHDAVENTGADSGAAPNDGGGDGGSEGASSGDDDSSANDAART
jgi:transcriptional regulator with GAF, ATPase, and Fis domain